MRARAAVALAPVLALTLALSAGCSGGGDEGGAGDEARGPVGTTVPADPAASGTEIETGDDDGAATELEIGASETASELERRISETLSELDAEQRGADTVVVIPEQVLFAFGEHELLPEAATVLDRLVEVMQHYGSAPVRVDGHTDAIGSDAANQALSERRAQAVVDHLVAAGVDPGRLRAQGFGESRPVAPNTHPDGADDPDGRARNRRVEVVLEGVTAPPPAG